MSSSTAPNNATNAINNNNNANGTATATKKTIGLEAAPLWIKLSLYLYAFAIVSTFLIEWWYIPIKLGAAPAAEGFYANGQIDSLKLAFVAAVAITFLRYFLLYPFLKFLAQKVHVRGKEENKFTESAWKLFAYGTVLAWGVKIIHNKTYLFDTNECWRNFPNIYLDWEEHAYYVVQVGYYVHMLVTVFIDIRRKDFLEYIVHHMVTLVLTIFSFYVGYYRIGILILVTHDVNDVLMETAKICKYVGFETAANVFFGVFTVVWLIVRLIYFPFALIYSTLIEAPLIIGTLSSNLELRKHIAEGHLAPFYVFFNLLLIGLVVLHVYWFTLILKMVLKFVYLKPNEDFDDIREMSDDEDESDHHTNKTKKSNKKSQ